MLVYLTFMHRDVIDNTVYDCLDAQLKDELRGCLEKFIGFGSCITIEFDTETQTANVMPAAKGWNHE